MYSEVAFAKTPSTQCLIGSVLKHLLGRLPQDFDVSQPGFFRKAHASLLHMGSMCLWLSRGFFSYRTPKREGFGGVLGSRDGAKVHAVRAASTANAIVGCHPPIKVAGAGCLQDCHVDNLRPRVSKV